MTSNRDEQSTEKEPVMCSKCNEAFETDSKFIQHYNEKHKAEETEQAQKQSLTKTNRQYNITESLFGLGHNALAVSHMAVSLIESNLFRRSQKFP